MKLTALILCMSLTGCATIRRHPVATGLITGAAVGVTVGLATRQHSCTYPYEGGIYRGTTCPKH